MARQSSGNNPHPTTLEEAFAGTDFPMSSGPTPLCGPRAVPGECTDVCGFVKHPNSRDVWKIRLHGAFTTHERNPGPSSKSSELPPQSIATLGPCQQSIAHESRGNHEQCVLLKEISCPYPPTNERGRYDDGSDHSISSLSSAREHMLPQAGAACHLTSTCDLHQRASRS